MKNRSNGISFQVDRYNLYREEAITDLKSATIRKLTPIHPDGSEDPTRNIIFMGHAELISPQGPVPIQADLSAASLEDAINALPAAMEKAAHQVRDEYHRMLQQQQAQDKVIKSGETVS